EERVETGTDGGAQLRAVSTHCGLVVPVRVVAGAQVEQELGHAGAAVTRVGGGAVPQCVGDARHPVLAEGPLRAAFAEVEERVDALGRGRPDLLDQAAARTAGEVCRAAARGGSLPLTSSLPVRRLVHGGPLEGWRGD